MKKYFIMTLAALLMAGCSDEIETEAPATTQEGRTVTIRATIADGADTRVALGESSDGKTPIHWKEGDTFTLWKLSYDETTEMSSWDSIATFTAQTVNGTSATFTADIEEGTEIAGTYYAEYGEQAKHNEQAGTREEVGNYIRMTTDNFTLGENDDFENLSLTFKPQNPIIHATLTNEDFKNKDVTNVVLRAPDHISATGTFTKNEEGKIEAWFVLPYYYPETFTGETIADFKVAACCGSEYYEADLATGKTVVDAKIYHVTREMKTVSEQTNINMQILYGEADEDGNITITLTGNLTITDAFNNGAAFYVPNGKEVTIKGSDGDTPTISLGQNATNVHHLITAVGNVTLENVTLESNLTDAAILVSDATVTLGSGATVKGTIEMYGGELTLNDGSKVNLQLVESQPQSLIVRYGGVVTFSGGTVSSSEDRTKHVYLDMENADGEDYIPLVCKAKPTGENVPLWIYVQTTDDSQKTINIATVGEGYNASTDDFSLQGWGYVLNGTDTSIKGNFSLESGTLKLVQQETTTETGE